MHSLHPSMLSPDAAISNAVCVGKPAVVLRCWASGLSPCVAPAQSRTQGHLWA